jgi:FtsP/CotA-like multicopper oxidase with cupredoxin domain
MLLRGGQPSVLDLVPPFADRLRCPPVLRPDSRDRVDRYHVEVRPARARLHSSLPDTPLWTYGGVYPGPTIEAQRDHPVEIEWVNNLGDAPHPIGTFVADPASAQTSQSHANREATGRWQNGTALPPWIVTHLHGAVVPPTSDGWPDNAYLPGLSVTNHYPNRQRATLLWYHDHAMGQTSQNVYAGLAGLYIVRDADERSLQLPAGALELPLLIQDRNLDLDSNGDPTGALLYQLDQPYGEFYGPFTLVNGTIWPYADVPAVPHRLRILNGSNARVYRLFLTDDDEGRLSGDAVMVIGNDGGLLVAPVPAAEGVLLAPGERIDVVVDFGAYAGRRLLLRNDAPAPFPSGQLPAVDLVMEFRVSASGQRSAPPLPHELSTIAPLPVAPGSVERVIRLEEDAAQPGLMRLNGKGFHDGIDEMPVLGETEVWEFQNPTDDTHPMHLHLVQVQILSRTHLDPAHPSGQPLTIVANERGWKDVVCCHPGQRTRVALRFGPYTGQYMYHCHILEHEDHDMMRPYLVVPARMSPVATSDPGARPGP